MKKGWKNIALITTISVVVFGGSIFWLGWSGSAKDLEQVANQFRPNSSWELKSETIEPPRTLCFDVTCPSLRREWRTDAPLSRDDFLSILMKSGWDFSIKGDCKLDQNSYGDNISLCSASGIVDNYRVEITVSGSNPVKNAFVELGVEKE